jgi:sterol desaturase/sphingolipid hydroxylase (fatty acid hydroxylase superfamily)
VDSPNLIALAIPFFFLFIGIEWLVARARRRPVYRLADAIGDLGCGVGQQVVLVFAGASLLAAYAGIYERWRIHTFAPGSLAPWILAFVAVDLIYYWWHRASHEVNLLWAAHVVHHQSEDYNLAVALRQAVATSFTSLPFYLPMALLGVPPLAYAVTVSLSTLYQFWIHTELVGSLGPLELFLNTPSHHRVHHAVNPRYLDRNYGATLIVWDRIFGTFAREVEPPVYGTVKPLRSFDPLWAQLAYWVELWRRARAMPSWKDRAWLWLAPPTWAPAGAPPLEMPEVATRRKHDPAVPAGVKAYAVLNFVPAVVATFLMLLWQRSLPAPALAAAAAFVFWTLASVGGLLDGRRWAVPLEVLRLAALCGLALAA